MFPPTKEIQENAAEYILYMWHIEDIIRANGFDITMLEVALFKGLKLDIDQEAALRSWYMDLISQMNVERPANHLPELERLVDELGKMHGVLVSDKKDAGYLQILNEAREHIDELKRKSLGNYKSDIELCLQALYGLWMLKLKKQEISQETAFSFEKIKKVVAYLSKEYKQAQLASL